MRDVEAPAPECRGEKARALGCQGCSTSWPDPDSPRGGHFLSKVPLPPLFAVTRQSQKYLTLVETLLPSLFPSVFCSQSSVESRSPDRFLAKGSQQEAEKCLVLSPLSFVCRRLGLGWALPRVCYSLLWFAAPCLSCMLESFLQFLPVAHSTFPHSSNRGLYLSVAQRVSVAKW